MRPAKRIGLIVSSAVLLGALGLCIAFAIDTSGDGNQVRRNVALAGAPIGGMKSDQLNEHLNSLADDYSQTSILVGRETRFSIPAGGIELALDEDATAESALRTGRNGNCPSRVVNWTKSFVRPQAVAVSVTFDDAALRRGVQAGDSSPRKEPVEPGFAVEQGRLTAVPGVDGRGIDPKRVADKLDDAATLGTPLEVELAPSDIEPRFSVEDAQALALRMETSVIAPLAASAGGAQKDIPSERVRTWLVTEPGDNELLASVETDRIRKDLEEVFGDSGVRPREPAFDVVFDRPFVVDGANGTACCAAEALPAVASVVEQRIAGANPTDRIELPLKVIEPSTKADDLRKLGITEPIGTFTTSFAAGQPRVTNIHRISDLTRGSVMKPGETFSINEKVGRRTLANGFVVDGVIEDGEFKEDVGGGISQYATTLFNAAFFGGLDFGEYQAHTIYIPRYPYGREATVAFPHPDLQIRNTTPHGVLIWPTYSNTSITVTIYSSPYARGEQTGQSESKVGECTKVTTERLRSYVDGRSASDSVQAIYQPEEGKQC